MKNLGKRKDVFEPFWWVGEIFECWKCKNRYMLFEADVPRKEEFKNDRSDDREGGGPPDTTYYRVTCPVCKSLHKIRIIDHT